MRLIAPRLFLLLLFPFSLFAQKTRPAVSKTPDWVSVNPVSYEPTGLDAQADDGYMDGLLMGLIKNQLSLKQRKAV